MTFHSLSELVEYGSFLIGEMINYYKTVVVQGFPQNMRLVVREKKNHRGDHGPDPLGLKTAAGGAGSASGEDSAGVGVASFGVAILCSVWLVADFSAHMLAFRFSSCPASTSTNVSEDSLANSFLLGFCAIYSS